MFELMENAFIEVCCLAVTVASSLPPEIGRITPRDVITPTLRTTGLMEVVPSLSFVIQGLFIGILQGILSLDLLHATYLTIRAQRRTFMRKYRNF
jgi:hypothetical protein